MRIDLDDLPTNPELLQRLVRDLVADKERRDGEIDKLRLIIKQLQQPRIWTALPACFRSTDIRASSD